MTSLSLQRQSFEQQVDDAEQLISDSADQMSRLIDNERHRLLNETAMMRHNTTTEIDKVTQSRVSKNKTYSASRHKINNL